MRFNKPAFTRKIVGKKKKAFCSLIFNLEIPISCRSQATGQLAILLGFSSFNPCNLNERGQSVQTFIPPNTAIAVHHISMYQNSIIVEPSTDLEITRFSYAYWVGERSHLKSTISYCAFAELNLITSSGAEYQVASVVLNDVSQIW